MKKKLIVFIIVLGVITSVLCTLPLFFKNGGEGLSFNEMFLYKTKMPLEETPRSFEVSFKAEDGESGVLLSNFGQSSGTYYSLEIMPSGAVRFLLKNNDVFAATFTQVNVFSNDFINLSLVLEDEKAVLYINGKKAQDTPLKSDILDNFSCSRPLCVGGDFRKSNSSFFKGKIRTVRVYKTIKNAFSVKLNTLFPNLDKSGILCAFEFEKPSQMTYKGVKNTLSYATDIQSLEGVEFFDDRPYKTMTNDFSVSKTFEMWVKVPSDTKEAGDILSTYTDNETPFYFIKLGEGGKVIFSLKEGESFTNAVFDSAPLYTGEWEHLALVIEETSVVLYINGEEFGRKPVDYSLIKAWNENLPITVGRGFKGKLAYLCAYSDARTAEEIKFDMSLPALDKENLKYAFEFNKNRRARYEDLSGNGFTLTYNGRDLLDDVMPLSDYAYSFAVLGDTQAVNYYDDRKLVEVYEWIRDNAEEKKIKYVLGLGDITDTSSEREWKAAVEGVSKLNGVVPYTIIRGNHDKSADYINYFPFKQLTDKSNGSFDGNSFNTYQKFTVGDTKWLVLGLDYYPTDSVLDWAGVQIALNPDYNVIITTHRYLGHGGEPYPDDKEGNHFWDRFVSQYKNVVMVLSGHYAVTDVIISQKEGVNGNTVTQMLIDPQYEDKRECLIGAVTMLYFSPDGKTVQVRNHSALLNCYLGSKSQTTIKLDLVD